MMLRSAWSNLVVDNGGEAKLKAARQAAGQGDFF